MVDAVDARAVPVMYLVPDIFQGYVVPRHLRISRVDEAEFGNKLHEFMNIHDPAELRMDKLYEWVNLAKYVIYHYDLNKYACDVFNYIKSVILISEAKEIRDTITRYAHDVKDEVGIYLKNNIEDYILEQVRARGGEPHPHMHMHQHQHQQRVFPEPPPLVRQVQHEFLRQDDVPNNDNNNEPNKYNNDNHHNDNHNGENVEVQAAAPARYAEVRPGVEAGGVGFGVEWFDQ